MTGRFIGLVSAFRCFKRNSAATQPLCCVEQAGPRRYSIRTGLCSSPSLCRSRSQTRSNAHQSPPLAHLLYILVRFCMRNQNLRAVRWPLWPALRRLFNSNGFYFCYPLVGEAVSPGFCLPRLPLSSFGWYLYLERNTCRTLKIRLDIHLHDYL